MNRGGGAHRDDGQSDHSENNTTHKQIIIRKEGSKKVEGTQKDVKESALLMWFKKEKGTS